MGIGALEYTPGSDVLLGGGLGGVGIFDGGPLGAASTAGALPPCGGIGFGDVPEAAGVGWVVFVFESEYCRNAAWMGRHGFTRGGLEFEFVAGALPSLLGDSAGDAALLGAPCTGSLVSGKLCESMGLAAAPAALLGKAAGATFADDFVAAWTGGAAAWSEDGDADREIEKGNFKNRDFGGGALFAFGSAAVAWIWPVVTVGGAVDTAPTVVAGLAVLTALG
jgi:hypothetical protein